MPNESRDTTLGALLQLVAALAAHREELPQLEPYRLKLAALVEAFQAVLSEQASLIAMKQEASQKADLLLGEVRRTATLLRVGIKEHYGSSSEKLAAFGLHPSGAASLVRVRTRRRRRPRPILTRPRSPWGRSPWLRPPLAVLQNSSPVLQNLSPVLQNPPRVLANLARVLQNAREVLKNEPRVLQNSWRVRPNARRVLQNSPRVLQNPGRVLQNFPRVLQNS
jgi:hypothetical protein